MSRPQQLLKCNEAGPWVLGTGKEQCISTNVKNNTQKRWAKKNNNMPMAWALKAPPLALLASDGIGS